jgi:uncharacterized membrane protein (UPF0136 family)
MISSKFYKDSDTMKSGFIVLLYAVLVLIGGFIGYVKAASIFSLATGVAASLVLALSAFAMITNRIQGFYVSLFVSALLCVFFVYRFVITTKFLPAGLMSFLSALMVLCLLLGGIPKSRPDL